MFRDIGWTLTGNWPYVDLAGPASGLAKSTYNYLATFSPLTTTLPVTYTWTASDLAPVTHPARGVSDTIDLNWTTPGTKNVVVTASGAGLPVSTTLTVSIAGLVVSGPVSGTVQMAYSYAASFSPAGTTQPLTYTWVASDLPAVVHTGKGVNDSALFTWTTPETKTVTVTASGSGVPVSDTLSVFIRPFCRIQFTFPSSCEAIDRGYSGLQKDCDMQPSASTDSRSVVNLHKDASNFSQPCSAD